jgi:hypothetical protein
VLKLAEAPPPATRSNLVRHAGVLTIALIPKHNPPRLLYNIQVYSIQYDDTQSLSAFVAGGYEEARMANETELAEHDRDVIREWLARLEGAMAAQDWTAAADLVRDDGCWRDMLGVTGQLRNAQGADRVASMLASGPADAGAATFRILKVLKAEYSSRLARDSIDAIFEFCGPLGRGQGLVRVLRKDVDLDLPRAWVVFTTLDALPGRNGADDADLKIQIRDSMLEDAVAVRQRAADVHTRVSKSAAAQAFDGIEPTVLVVGAGQSGLAVAARLQRAGVSTVVVDKHRRIGDNWRSRYDSLWLHNECWGNHLPFMPFPSSWFSYLSKDKLACWLESYAAMLELNVWTSTSFEAATYDEDAGTWNVTLTSDSNLHHVRPRHIIMATGVSGVPRIPRLPDLDSYRGTILHSSEYANGSAHAGTRVLVIGTGVSGHDIAQDLFVHGAEVVMLQRSPTTILTLETCATTGYGLWREGRSTDECDLLAMSAGYPVWAEWLRELTRQQCVLDQDLLDRLEAVGFRTDIGEDGTGYLMKYRRRGGGYYIDVGCSELIANGKIPVRQASDVIRFTESGVDYQDGSSAIFDALVFATGYHDLNFEIERLFGSAVARRIGQVWGLDDEGELRNIARPTGQPGFWVLAGGLPEARQYSKLLALQICALEGRRSDLASASHRSG